MPSCGTTFGVALRGCWWEACQPSHDGQMVVVVVTWPLGVARPIAPPHGKPLRTGQDVRAQTVNTYRSPLSHSAYQGRPMVAGELPWLGLHRPMRCSSELDRVHTCPFNFLRPVYLRTVTHSCRPGCGRGALLSQWLAAVQAGTQQVMYTCISVA